MDDFNTLKMTANCKSYLDKSYMPIKMTINNNNSGQSKDEEKKNPGQSPQSYLEWQGKKITELDY